VSVIQTSTRVRDIAIAVSAGAVMLLGVAVMLAWHAGFTRVIQLGPGIAPVQYNTALCFALCGAAVLLLRFARGVALVCSAVAFGVAGVTLLQYVLGANLGLDELVVRGYASVATQYIGRMSPQAGVALMLAAVAVALLARRWPARRGTLVVEILSSVVGAIGLAAIAAQASGIDEVLGWGQLKRMAPQSAGACVMLAFATLQAAWRQDEEAGSPGSRLLAMPVALGAVAVTLAVYQALLAWEVMRIHEVTSRIVERAAVDLRVRMNDYVESFGLLAQSWAEKGMRPQPSWETDVARFLRDHDGFLAISWGDVDGKLAWIFPAAPFNDHLGVDYTADTQRLSALMAARERGGPVLSRTIALMSGLTGVIMVAPLRAGEINGGGPFIVGAIRTRDLFRLSALMVPGFWLEAFDDDKLTYTSADGSSVHNAWTQGSGVRVDRGAWRLEVTPTPATLNVMRSPLPAFVLASGIFASLLLALTAHLAQVSRRRATALLSANRELAAAKSRLERLALFDELTGLGNRNLLAFELDRQLLAARAHALALPLLLVDLDGFKQINDRFGHEAGDAVLREFGIRLQDTLREGDQGFRAGGDEFAVLARPGTSLDEAVAIAREIVAATSAPLLVAGEQSVVTASIGIAAYPEHGRERERLMRSADAAMYQAKHEGKHVHVATEESPTGVLQALRGGLAPRA
jgi:diguanylate cyclase (GGDEF)-like protein